MFQSLLGINKNDNQVNIKPICISGLNCVNDSNKSTIPSTSRPSNQAEGQPCRSERINGLYDADGNCIPSGLTPTPSISSNKKQSGESCTVLVGGNSNTECDSSKSLYCSDGNIPPTVGNRGKCASIPSPSTSSNSPENIPESCKQIAASAGDRSTVSYSTLLNSYLVAGGSLESPVKCQ
jgi:hypothetical protein